jgi:hypothetical protein
VIINGKLLGRRFFTRGSTRWGRMGFTINATHGLPVLGALSQRSASPKLIRSPAIGCSEADWHITRRTRVETMAKAVNAVNTPGTVWPGRTSLGMRVVS